jgi:hypothetical protein
MTHNTIDFKQDIFGVTKNFFINHEIEISHLKNCFNFEDENYKKLFKVPEYLEHYYEEKIFKISKFSKIKEIPCDNKNNICILPLSNDSFIYSFDNIIKIYKYNEEKLYIQEEKFIKIKSLNYFFENKFIYLTDEDHIKIYSFNFNNNIFINKIELESPRKVIVSEDNNIIVLGKKLFKIDNPEIKKDTKIKNILGKINEFPIKIFSDILEIKKNIIVLSSNHLLASININNNIIVNIIKNNFSLIENNNLFKLNENKFILIEDNKLSIFDSNKFTLLNIINNHDIFLNVINEEKILLKDKNKKYIVKQMNLKKNNSIESELKLTSKKELESIYIMKNKKVVISVIKKVQNNIIYQNIEEYSIEIWGKENEEKKKATCALSSIS